MFKEGRPLWGLKIRANEGRGQTCLDYAKCSRIWRNSKKHCVFFYGGLNNDGRRSRPLWGGKIIFQMILQGIRQGRAYSARPARHGGESKDSKAEAYKNEDYNHKRSEP